MKMLLSALALSIATVTAAHASEPFHRSYESGAVVFRGAPTLPATSYVTPGLQRRALELQKKQFEAQSRLEARRLDILATRAQAYARYQRSLERNETALVRGSGVYPRFNQFGYNQFGYNGAFIQNGFLNTRHTPRRAKH